MTDRAPSPEPPSQPDLLARLDRAYDAAMRLTGDDQVVIVAAITAAMKALRATSRPPLGEDERWRDMQGCDRCQDAGHPASECPDGPPLAAPSESHAWVELRRAIDDGHVPTIKACIERFAAAIRAGAASPGASPPAAPHGYGHEWRDGWRVGFAAALRSMQPSQPGEPPSMNGWSANPDAYELLEQAWGIIANASEGNWLEQTSEWRQWAAHWRDRYMAFGRATSRPVPLAAPRRTPEGNLDLEHAIKERDEARRQVRKLEMKLPAVRSEEPEARKEALEEAAQLASLFTVRPNASIYPGMDWKDMNESAQTASHTTAQQIAAEIRALAARPRGEPKHELPPLAYGDMVSQGVSPYPANEPPPSREGT